MKWLLQKAALAPGALMDALCRWSGRSARITGLEQHARELRAELARRTESERGARHMRAIVETAIDGIVTIDAQGIVRSFNPAAEHIFGYSADEVIGRNVSLLMREPERAAHDGYIARYVETGQKHIIGIGREVEGQRKDGATVMLELAVSESDYSDGERVFTGIIRDIGERKKIERLKNEFISTVSHELRTPLTSVLGALGLLRGGTLGEVPEKARALVEIAYKNSDRLVRLINDILDVEKIESGKMEFHLRPVELTAVIRQAIETNRELAERHQVNLVFESALPGIALGDSDRLIQAITNLVSNAIKFSPPHTQVGIATQATPHGMRVAVTDRGPGVPEEFRDRLFEKFSQADASDARRKGGTGLGLSLVKAIAERHGGQVGFEGAAGGGSVFYIDLPTEADTDLGALDTIECYCRHVLLCEADAELAAGLQGLLQRGGFEVAVAANAAEARSRLAEGRFAAMAIDPRLPDQDGLSLLQELRGEATLRDLPIVVVGAEAGAPAGNLVGSAVGIVDWMQHPIDEDRLLRALRMVARCELEGRPRILHVEDDPDLLALTAALLHDVAILVPACSYEEGRRRLTRERFDLVILDLMLPDGSGEELLPLTQLPNQAATPVIVFSAKEVSRDVASNIVAALVKSRASLDVLAGVVKSLVAREAPRSQSLRSAVSA